MGINWELVGSLSWLVIVFGVLPWILFRKPRKNDFYGFVGIMIMALGFIEATFGFIPFLAVDTTSAIILIVGIAFYIHGLRKPEGS